MRTRFMVVLLVFCSLLLSCQVSAPSGSQGNTTAIVPSEKPASPGSPATTTQAPTPSATPAPTTATPSPAPPSVTPTSSLPAGLIAAGNLDQLTKLAATRQTSLGMVTAGAWSPDGKLLALGFDRLILLVDTTSWQTIWKVEAKGKVRQLEFSPDGKLLAYDSDKAGAMLEAASGKFLYTIGGIIAFSPDSKLLAFTNLLLNSQTGETVRELPMPKFIQEDYETPEIVAFSPDGVYMMMGLDKGGFIAWDVASGRQIFRVAADNPFVECDRGARTTNWLTLYCYYPYDNYSKVDIQLRYVNLAKAPTVRLHVVRDVKSGEYGHYTFIPGQTIFAWVKSNEIQMLDAANNFYARDALAGIPAKGAGFAFSPVEKGRLLALWNKDILQIWDTSTKKIAIQFGEEGVTSLALLPNNSAQVALSRESGRFEIIDLKSGKITFAIAPHNLLPFGFAIHPDGKTLITTGFDYRARLWDLAALKTTPLVEKQTNWRILSPVYHPKGTEVVILYDSAFYFHIADPHLEKLNLREIRHEQALVIPGAAYHPNGDWLASISYNGIIELRDSVSGAVQKKIQLNRRPASYRLSVSPDGSMLIISGWGVWDIKQNRALIEFPASVQDAAFSPDQCLLAAATKEGQVWLWDLSASKQLKALSAHKNSVSSLVFSPDGRLLYTASLDGSLAAWGLPGSLEILTTQKADIRCSAPANPLPTVAPTPTPTRTPTATRPPTLTPRAAPSATLRP